RKGQERLQWETGPVADQLAVPSGRRDRGMGQRIRDRRRIGRTRSRREQDASLEVEQRVHRQRRNAAGDAAERSLRRREGRGLREVRVVAVEKDGRVPGYAPVDGEVTGAVTGDVTSAQSDASASVPSLSAKIRNDAGDPRSR